MSQIALIEHGTGREVTDPREFEDVIYRSGVNRDAAGLRRVLDLGLLDTKQHPDIPDYRFEAIERSLMWSGSAPMDRQLLEDWLAVTVANRPVVAAKMMNDAIGKMSSNTAAARAFQLWLSAGVDMCQRVPGNDGYPKAGYGSRAKLAFRDCAPIVSLFHSGSNRVVEDFLYGDIPQESLNKMLDKVTTFVTPGGVRIECNLFEFMAYAHSNGSRFRAAAGAVDTDRPEVREALADTAASIIAAHRLGRAATRHQSDTVSKVASLIVFGADMPRLARHLEVLSKTKKADPGYGLYPLLAKVDRGLDDSTNVTDVGGVHYFHIEQAVARMAGIGDFAHEGKSGIDINARDQTGQTALHLAAQFGSYQMIENLLLAGVDTNAKTNDGKLVDDYIQRYRKNQVVALQPMVLAARARQAIASTIERARARTDPPTP